MPSVHDVAAYILCSRGSMTAMKLQKLVYYCQAWSLVWDEKPLFSEKIEAWANGPVVRELYEKHRGVFRVSQWDGDPNTLDKDERETIDSVLGFYAAFTSLQLSNMTHQEDPWRNAREGMLPGERGNAEITHAAMFEYYSGL